MQAFQAFVSVQEREDNAFVQGPGANDGLVGCEIHPPLISPKAGKKVGTKMRRGQKEVGRGHQPQLTGMSPRKKLGRKMEPVQPS